jgi:pilus assembly protein FimV
MSGKLRVLISAILLTPAAAFGLGLGEIRLNSALNQPFSAEIDLVAATPEELAALDAHLASPEVFARYGLDRPAFLSSLEFNVGRGQDGRSVLLVRSRDAIGEPFVSFLIDVNWPRGRLLREYTVLLDPPAMLSPGESPAPAPVAAPTTTRAPAPSAPEPEARPAPQPVAPAAQPAAAAAPAYDASSYTVSRGDTLYGIAGSIAGGDRQAIQRTMIALFRANPEAFNGNINQLRAGAILRVPSSDEVTGISASDASSEIRQQNAAWRAATGAAEEGRLKLVTPPEGEGETAAAPQSSGRVEGQIDALEKDIAEQRRLLELRNQELADLQRKLAEARAQEQAAQPPVQPEPVPEAPAEPTDEAAIAPEDDVQEPAAPPTEAAPPEPESKPAPEPAAEAGPSLMDRLADNWKILAGAIAVLLLAVFGINFIRRRREEDVDGALRNFEVPPSAPVPTETMRLRALATGDRTAEMPRPPMFQEEEDEDEGDIVVEERPVARPKTEAPRPSAGHEETISAEAALDLDQADPLAEADFHMAYGLYDQAVDLVRMALQKEPSRNDLKLKLAEIHFVAGDTNQFLTVARDLKKSLGGGGDWDRIVIMGRQLAPDEPMFAGAVQDAGVDLSLEGGDNLVDLDLLSAPEGDEGLDLDLGKVAAATADGDATGENTALEFDLSDTAARFTTTQEIAGREGGGTVEMPTLEIPSSETPTVETPALKASQAARDRMQPATPDSTAEMAIDDLGLDLGNLDNLPDIDDATAIATGLHEDLTQIAAHTQTEVLPRDESGEGDETALMPGGAGGETAILPPIDFGEIDLDVGGATDAADESPTVRDTTLKTEQMPQLSNLEPVTMSEVGTKLDLARAYMDMGDPDGARNILQEVLAEGSASQKQEARRLIDSLPGA